MELNKTKRWIYLGSIFSVAFVFLLGSWWLYLVFKLATRLSELNIPELKGNLVYMVQWEGITFIVALFLITAAHVYMFFLDQKKTRALSAFFASMGHELKTPLASIRLQGQVIADLATDLPGHEKLTKYIDRLKEDTERLENELEKSLQLSRLEIGGNLNQVDIELVPFIRKLAEQYPLTIDLKDDQSAIVKADEQALTTIFRNLFENTIRHNSTQSPSCQVQLLHDGLYVTIQYVDNAHFEGNLKRLGQLFYKHNSPKGSGVGLYLIRKLCHKMSGSLTIKQKEDSLQFIIKLPMGDKNE